MKTLKLQILPLLLLLTLQGYAQTTLEGRVNDEDGIPLVGANVFIKGTYRGTITDPEGHYVLALASASDSVLVVSFMGYKRKEVEIKPDTTNLQVILEKTPDELEAVVITAGAFAAGEKSRAVLLNPIEIATTASSDGDVYGALSTFPGAQKQGESGKLIVRGGDAYETKTFIDGMLVSSPYGSRMPDLPTRGRFTPFMFNGVMFSTGGYSAEYGQALSSILELQTPGNFDEDITSISLMNVGAGLSHTRHNVRSGYSAELNYNNTYPYFAMATHELDWIHVPQNVEGKFFHRQKIGKSGLLKTDIITSYSGSKLDYSNSDIGYSIIGLRNDNQLVKTTFNTDLNKKWMLKSGIAYNRNHDITSLDQDELKKNLGTLHIKLSLTHFQSDALSFRLGSDATYLDYRFRFHLDSLAENYSLPVKDWILASYMEADVRLNKKTALRLGARSEYSTYTHETKLAPRTSMAYRIGEHSQLSAAWGIFYQQGGADYLKYSDALSFESAQHILFNYQYQKNRRILRAEIFNKQYNKLITYQPGQYEEYTDLANDGDGYARGIDLFWKDDASFRNLTYWISYSYIDSKRRYKDYPEMATPDFVSPHNLSIVFKYWWNLIHTQFSATYTYASGRSYFNPNSEDFMSNHTPAIHDLSANASYVTDLFGWASVVHLSVSNVLGTSHIYSYRYAPEPDPQGVYEGVAIRNKVRRTIIIGLFISID